MKVTELRIGNWIQDPGEGDALQVTKITTDDFTAGPLTVYPAGLEAGDYGIALTAEWLERFGFHLTLSNAVEHTESGFTIYADDEEGQDLKYYFLTDNSGTVWIDHVHQLQNLYFALTGTELELKP